MFENINTVQLPYNHCVRLGMEIVKFEIKYSY